jgi:hypothetical protein
MSLQSQPIGPIPAETVRVALAAFPIGNIYMLIRDELGTIYENAALPDIFAEDVPVWWRQAPAIETLRRVWVQ